VLGEDGTLLYSPIFPSPHVHYDEVLKMKRCVFVVYMVVLLMDSKERRQEEYWGYSILRLATESVIVMHNRPLKCDLKSVRV
jgi:hypothetical protein